MGSDSLIKISNNCDWKTLITALKLDIGDGVVELLKRDDRNEHATRREKLQAKFIKRKVEKYAHCVQDCRTEVKKLYHIQDKILHYQAQVIMCSFVEQLVESRVGVNDEQQQNPQDDHHVTTPLLLQDKVVSTEEINEEVAGAGCREGQTPMLAEDQAYLSLEAKDTEIVARPRTSVQKMISFFNNLRSMSKKNDKKISGPTLGKGVVKASHESDESEGNLTAMESFGSSEDNGNTYDGMDDVEQTDTEKPSGETPTPTPPNDESNDNPFCYEGIDILDPNTFETTINVASPKARKRLKKIMFQRLTNQLELQNMAKRSPLVQELTRQHTENGKVSEKTHSDGWVPPRHKKEEHAVLEGLVNVFVDRFVGIVA